MAPDHLGASDLARGQVWHERCCLRPEARVGRIEDIDQEHGAVALSVLDGPGKGLRVRVDFGHLLATWMMEMP